MAARRLKMPPPAEKVAPEIQAALIIKVDLVIPHEDDFKGYVREEHIMDMNPKQRATAIRWSQMEEYSDWQTQVIVDLHAACRQMDVRLAISEYERDAARRALRIQKAWEKFFKWLGVTCVVALIGASAKFLIEWLAK